RLHTIDCEIAVRLWAAEHGLAVDYLSSFFDVTGANRSKTQPRRRSLTKIDLADGTGIIPDSVFHLTDSDGSPRLFVLEMYNQWRTSPPSKAAVTFLRLTAGNEKGSRLSSVMAGAALSVLAKMMCLSQNLTSYQRLALCSPVPW
ncbi:MAG: hypothetical protein H7X89_08440, partial [Rhizobiales bacterium]|nr:hypothetical protein [Hyphomicrobiales bacterium]